MKKASCRITAYGFTFTEVQENIKKAIQKFLEVTDEEFPALYERLEVNLRIELASAESFSFFADATFEVPDLK